MEGENLALTKTKKMRSLNFSMSEKNVLIKEMRKVKNRMDGNEGKITTEEKMNIWEDLASKVSMVGYCKRTREETRIKWGNMTRETKEAHMIYNKATRATGGGSPVSPLTQEQEDIVNLNKNANYEGIEGGQESEIEGCVRLPMHVVIPTTKKVVVIPTSKNATCSVADEQEATLPDAFSQEAPTKRFKHSTEYIPQEATQQPKLPKSPERDAQQVAPNRSKHSTETKQSVMEKGVDNSISTSSLVAPMKSLVKKNKLTQESVWAAQLELIQEQKTNLLLDRERMAVQMDVLTLVKTSLEKREKQDKDLEDRFPISDFMNIISPNV